MRSSDLKTIFARLKKKRRLLFEFSSKEAAAFTPSSL